MVYERFKLYKVVLWILKNLLKTMKHFAELLLNNKIFKSQDQVPFIEGKRGIEIKTSREIKLIKKSSQIVSKVLSEILI